MTTLTKKPKSLTKRQVVFRDAILGGFTPSEAYKKSFNAKGMSKKAISTEAGRVLRYPHVSLSISLAVNGKAQPPLLPAVMPTIRLSMDERLEELRCAARLDPADAFNEHNHCKSIREMPEHVRRAIAGFEVDPVSFVIKVKFVDKRGAIMDYSKLAGDIPREKGPVAPPSRSRFDMTKLTDEEFKEHLRLRKKALIEGPET